MDIRPQFGAWRGGRWLVTNALGFVVGFAALGWIGHGLTGDHGDALTRPQLLAHSVGLAVASALIVSAQALGSGRCPTASRWTLTLIGAPLVFWAGYYGLGIPFDLLLTFQVLGLNAGLLLEDRLGGTAWRFAGPLCFSAGLGLTAALTYPLADSLQTSFGGGIAGHITLFAFIGAVGGLGSGLALLGLVRSVEIWRGLTA